MKALVEKTTSEAEENRVKQTVLANLVRKSNAFYFKGRKDQLKEIRGKNEKANVKTTPLRP